MTAGADVEEVEARASGRNSLVIAAEGNRVKYGKADRMDGQTKPSVDLAFGEVRLSLTFLPFRVIGTDNFKEYPCYLALE